MINSKVIEDVGSLFPPPIVAVVARGDGGGGWRRRNKSMELNDEIS